MVMTLRMWMVWERVMSERQLLNLIPASIQTSTKLLTLSLVLSSQKVAFSDIVLTCRAAQLPSVSLTRACQRFVGTRPRLNAHKGPIVTGSQTVSQPLDNLCVLDLECDITTAVCHTYTRADRRRKHA